MLLLKRAKHDAVLIATGVYKARDIKPGISLKGLYLPVPDRFNKSLGDEVADFENGLLNAEAKMWW